MKLDERAVSKVRRFVNDDADPKICLPSANVIQLLTETNLHDNNQRSAIAGIRKIVRINKRLCLSARPDAILPDGSIVFIDDYWDFVPPAVVKQFEEKLMASLAAYKATTGYYITSKSKKVFTVSFNTNTWNTMQRSIKDWYQKNKKAIKREIT
jgi:hypothetical protein